MDTLEHLEKELEALLWVCFSSRYLFLIFEEKHIFLIFFDEHFLVAKNFRPIFNGISLYKQYRVVVIINPPLEVTTLYYFFRFL